MSNSCPYCTSISFELIIDADRKRKETDTLLKCNCCSGYSLKIGNGNIFPLRDRKDENSDVGNKVVD